MCALLATVMITLFMGPRVRSFDDREMTPEQFQEALKGEWQMTSRIEDGEPTEAQVVKNRTFIFETGKYSIRDAGKARIEATYKIDPTKKPAWFDITITSESSKGKVERGIIKIEGDTLTFCLVEANRVRPAEFRSHQGDHVLLATCKRVKK
jgi:uncharacterized protein (TIGR03067 family)